MDLGLETIRLNGRQEIALAPEYVRSLTEADLALMEVERGEQKPPHLKRLTQRHHALARALASGMRNWEAAMSAGYTESTVSILKNDPTFQNLVEFYKDAKDHEFRHVQAQMAGLASDLIESIADDLEDDKLSPGQKLQAAALVLDRTGNGPASSSTVKHEHTLKIADRVSAARKRLIERGAVIDVTPNTEQENAA